MTRTVNHRYDADALESLCESTSAVEVHKALGYLSTWGLSGYPVADLAIMGKPTDSEPMEILAYYRKEPGAMPGFVIGAVWNGERFGFHS